MSLPPPSPLVVGDLVLDPPLLLAPMAGVTDRDFRLIVRRIGGVGLVTMEFLAAKGLVGGDRRVWSLTHFVEEERPIGIQIYGSAATTMAEAARIVTAEGADLVDVNMGCPANKVLQGCAGAALMGDLPLATEIVRAVRRATPLPLTVKFRLGLDDRRRSFLELGRICQEEGVDAVTLHPRTASLGFRGEADWSAVAELATTLRIPVVGNGDLRDAADAVRRLRETGCAGVMIGRGATRNPWIFAQTAALLSGGRLPQPTLDDRRRLILDHFRAVVDREEATLALHKLRTFTGWYSHGLPAGQALRRRIQSLPTAEALAAAVDEHCRRQATAAARPDELEAAA